MTEEFTKYTPEDTRQTEPGLQIKDTPLTLATIQAFRDMLDVMEQFVRETERERLENEQ